MRDPDELFAALAGSRFRAHFRLRGPELAYLRRRGMDAVLRHADEMIGARLAPAHPPNDGRQTPMRGHPVFLAQHATATCCRGCLEKWHRIPRGRELTPGERRHVVSVLARWIAEQERAAPEPPEEGPDEQLGLGVE
ncbi:MAG TPA: DUF4186 domain-containing protein [Longimicrobium sp.]|jgi:predicted Fe-S protein YdhL (DUF1289 family)